MSDAPVGALVEGLFRRSAGRITASLARRFGHAHLAMIEESVQDALVRALELWPHRGVPGSPEGWLLQAARNRVLDRMRRDRSLARILSDLARTAAPEAPGATSAIRAGTVVIDDDELALLFLCCHPRLSPDARVALTLRLAGGFGVGEIARALLARPDAVAQRLVRAKRLLREPGVALELHAVELPARLASVLDALYLIFGEGYQATAGDAAVRRELCTEAIRMTRLVVALPATDTPAARALLALMLLQASRLPERPDDEIRLLDAQRRDRWSRAWIAEGLQLLDAAASGTELSEYHLEAGIAAEHAVAARWEDTRWPRIVRYYELLRRGNPSPVLALNHAIAVHMAEGASAAAPRFEQLATMPRLAGHFPYHVAAGRHAEERGEPGLARAHFERALALPCSAPERRFVAARLAKVVA